MRNYFFKDMRNLLYLNLNDNKIRTIEPKSFEDLVKVQDLMLHYNQIETIDSKLLVSMSKLKWLYLNNNKIKFLDPSTFVIPNGSLGAVFLRGNVCIDDSYDSQNWGSLQADLRNNCTFPHTFIASIDV